MAGPAVSPKCCFLVVSESHLVYGQIATQRQAVMAGPAVSPKCCFLVVAEPHLVYSQIATQRQAVMAGAGRFAEMLFPGSG